MAKKPKPTHKPQQKAGDDVTRFDVSLHDALNLSALRIYMLTIERLTLLIYRSDAPEDRPYFRKLEDLLVKFIDALHDFADGMPKPPHFKGPKRHEHDDENGEGKGPKGGGQCDPNDTFCPYDGLCHPPGDCC